MGVEKISWFWMGEDEMAVNRYFEYLEGRVGLNRVWEFIPNAGKKEE